MLSNVRLNSRPRSASAFQFVFPPAGWGVLELQGRLTVVMLWTSMCVQTVGSKDKQQVSYFSIPHHVIGLATLGRGVPTQAAVR